MLGLPVSVPPAQLFCSNSWDHVDHHNGLHGLINRKWFQGIDWVDCAVPRNHPIHESDPQRLREILRDRILYSDVFLVFAGVYSSHSEWIEFELATAFAQYKPIVAIAPRAQLKFSSVVMKYNPPLVGWNSTSVCSAIRTALPAQRRAELEHQLLLSEVIKTPPRVPISGLSALAAYGWPNP